MFQATRPLESGPGSRAAGTSNTDAQTPSKSNSDAQMGRRGKIGTIVEGSCVGHCTAHLTMASELSS